MSTCKIGQYVRLHTNDDWNGLYGIIDCVDKFAVHVFCVCKPCYMYYINPDDVLNVLELIDL